MEPLFNFIRWLMKPILSIKPILRISELIFAAGLWLFFIKWLIDGIKNARIKNKLFKNVIYEVFFNTLTMELTYETNRRILNRPHEYETDLIPHKYAFAAWQTLLQSALLRNMRLKDILFLQRLYFQIEEIDQFNKWHYNLRYEKQVESRNTLLEKTNSIAKLHNELINSKKFQNWVKKYGEYFKRHQLDLMPAFPMRFPPSPLPPVTRKV